MSIRRLLLAAFLLVSLLPAIGLTLLAFGQTRNAMLGEIEQNAHRSAGALSDDLDRQLYERLLNATTWSHLEVMQDLRLDDVDKRLSNFLAEMKRRYGGVYLALLAVDPQGRIVASSEPQRIGRHYAAITPWFVTKLPGGAVQIDPVAGGRLAIRTRLQSQFTEGTLGQLVLELDWAQLESSLDAVADATRQALVLDTQGRIVIASSGLRQRGAVPGTAATGWLPATPGTIQNRDGAPWMAVPVLVASTRSDGIGSFNGFGWTSLLLQSRDSALAPVQQMAWTFAGLLAATVLITILVSSWVAGVIARPVTALTQFTRHYLQPGPPPPAPPQGPGEIGELNRSFVRLVEELQRSQATLTQASKLAALGEITALMAHEVRTPLGILRSSAQMLKLEPALSSEGSELVGIIESETARLNRLVGSMLDSARTRPPQRRPDDIHDIITHAITLLGAQARARGIGIEFQADARDTMLDCDSEQISQVLLNLIMNALQILPRGGHVQVRSRDEAQRLVVEVDDDGPGIPAEDRIRIFEPFVFKREGGIGLGLAVVRQILRQHGGDIVADQSKLGGALFRFWLPRNHSEDS
ncbi:MAG: histidine kinase [Hydrocarboniphaga sp.]|uniref:sensor histidine kinase n=1 Tax=Hydrocarboniphaga sp. TaxID=2033016 RepID=UPI00260CC8AC|nr:sensor histidine kinase [Hydrocarboniphaga sp.]MDB5972545.1 histidine kinase [Hydrocarboniphaga sp.]